MILRDLESFILGKLSLIDQCPFDQFTPSDCFNRSVCFRFLVNDFPVKGWILLQLDRRLI